MMLHPPNGLQHPLLIMYDLGEATSKIIPWQIGDWTLSFPTMVLIMSKLIFILFYFLVKSKVIYMIDTLTL